MYEVIYILCYALLLWMPQNVIHEGSHALMGRTMGWRIKRFWPFPGCRLGYFTFAHVVFSLPPPRHMTRKRFGLIKIAPIFTNVVLIGWILVVSFRTDLPYWVAALALTNAIDLLNNCKNAIYFDDLIKFVTNDLCGAGYNWLWPDWKIRVAGIIGALYALVSISIISNAL